MTTEQTPERTLAQLREAADSNHAIGYDLACLAADVELLILERDVAREEADELRESGRILREALRDAAAHRDELRAVPRVITPDELREGQTVAARFSAIWAVLRAGITSNGPWLYGDALTDSAHHVDTIVLLEDAPDPEPELWEPSEGDVGIVTHFHGEELDEPVAAWFSGTSWYRVDRRSWPDWKPRASPHEVTVVRAKLVPDE